MKRVYMKTRRVYTKRRKQKSQKKRGGMKSTSPPDSRKRYRRNKQPEQPEKSKTRKLRLQTTHNLEANNLDLIGEDSINGVVFKLTAETDQNIERLVQYNPKPYEYRILKMSRDDSSKKQLRDSLIYEYQVGLFLNKYLMKFPCFVKTYNLYKFKIPAWSGKNSRDLITRFVSNKKYTYTEMKNSELNRDKLNKIMENVEIANIEKQYYDCDNKNDYGVEQEYVTGETLDNIIGKLEYTDEGDLIRAKLMFQIYGPLHAMRNIYEHRDLHSNNVIVHDMKRPIQFCYKFYNRNNEEGKENEVTEVKFMCKYLVKIIDYGRSYTSEEFTQSILKEYNNLDIEEDKRNFENYANYCGLLPLLYDGLEDIKLFNGVFNAGYRHTFMVLNTLTDILEEYEPKPERSINRLASVTIDLKENPDTMDLKNMTIEEEGLFK